MCTCVVHKRCHQHYVTKCPGSKEGASSDEIGEVRPSSILTSLICLREESSWSKIFKLSIETKEEEKAGSVVSIVGFIAYLA